MGELMFPTVLHHDAVDTDSAGIGGLIDSPIDSSSALLLACDGVDSRKFRSKRFTPQSVAANDQILCPTEHQHHQIVSSREDL